MYVYTRRGSELYIEDLKMTDLANRFGTPLHVFSEALMRSRFAEIKKDFIEKYAAYNGKGRTGAIASYAGKAFLPKAMCRLVDEEGFGLDVVSAGEFYTAISSGFPAERISYHGNNKSFTELSLAIEFGAGKIVVDGLGELDTISEIAAKHGKKQAILFRISPEVNAGAHSHVVTGDRDSKFGVPMDEDIIYPLIEKAIHDPNIIFKGLHFHIGSQILDNLPYINAVEKALEVHRETNNRFSYLIEELIIGGGFGIRYTKEDVRKPYSYYLDPVMQRIQDFCNQHGIVPPDVGIEPGRSIVGDAGVTLYTIGSIKQVPGGTKYVSVDGGMSDNIRPALYGAKYEAMVANKADGKALEKVTVCGKLCETGDKLIEGAEIAGAESGDILCVFSTGAYGFSMANNYNKTPKPAVVFVSGNEAREVVRRQTIESMIADEII